MGGSTSHIALRFAVISVLAAAVVSGLSGFAAWQIVQNSEQRAAARNADRLVGTPVRAALDGFRPATSGSTLPSSVSARLDALTAPLLSSDLRAVRLWSPDGEVAYQAGSDAGTMTPPALTDGTQATARGTAGDGTPTFAAYSTADGVVWRSRWTRVRWRRSTHRSRP